MTGNGRRDRMEKPLVGTVLCCTSIPPEQRTRYADIATQMGAEHKLDLTSDVTHLLVGDSNTLKYKYVAREREDVKVLNPVWLEAVRESWMTGDVFDLHALEEEHKLPVLAGLSVCVTGFDDLKFRAQLQAAIAANGGEYRGDLTRIVTHLIANEPQGKKYEYALQWEVKVVSLKWLKDSLERGMILDETLYRPTMSVSEQGRGAWNREAKAQTHLGKRTRDKRPVQEPPRKLRRTASAKLGSQTDTMWGDIVGGGFETGSEPEIPLRTSQSLPTLKPAVLEPKSFITEGDPEQANPATEQKWAERSLTTLRESRHDWFSGKTFFICGFSSKKESVLQNVLAGKGATLVDSLADLDDSHNPTFVVVPYDLPTIQIPFVDAMVPTPLVVTEMWIERCMESRGYLEPNGYSASTPVTQFPIDGFHGLSINSTGFEGVELMHVSKLVELVGATYDEVLKPSISILLCKQAKANAEKQYHARSWDIPVVSDTWLWACFQSGQLQPFLSYVVKSFQHEQIQGIREARKLDAHAALPEKAKNHADASTGSRTKAVGQERKLERSMSAKDLLNFKRRNELEQERGRPGADFHEDSDPGVTHIKRRFKAKQQNKHEDVGHAQRSTAIQPSPTTELEDGLALQDISTNSPPKPLASPPKKKKKSLFRSSDDTGSLPSTAAGDDPATDKDPGPGAPVPTSTEKTEYIAPETETINGAIQDLLNMKAKARVMDGQGKKTRLFDRALSHMSNSSREGSGVRPSRASSVDSMNTDGVGSIINGDTSQPTKPLSSAGRSGNFTGRAKPKDKRDKPAALELVDPQLYRDEFAEEEPAPPMTQLGYGENEDAIRIRERLAEKRRLRSKQGQETVTALKEERKIKDDDALTGGKWGAGRRTRHMDRSPKGMVDF